MTVTVAIDCMGGDHGPDVTVHAALDFVRKHEDACVILVGREERILPFLAKHGDARVSVRHATEVVAMDGSVVSSCLSNAKASLLWPELLRIKPLSAWMVVDDGSSLRACSICARASG